MEETKVRVKFATTTDNPYNYWTEFYEWYSFDTTSGYNTCAQIARYTSEDEPYLSEEEEQIAINKAVDKVVSLNISGNYRVTYQDEDDPESKG